MRCEVAALPTAGPPPRGIVTVNARRDEKGPKTYREHQHDGDDGDGVGDGGGDDNGGCECEGVGVGIMGGRPTNLGVAILA